MSKSKSLPKSPLKSMAKLAGVDVALRSKKWLALKNIDKFIANRVNKIAQLSPLKKFLPDVKIELAVLLCSNAQIKKINQQFRNKNQPTDILSFGNLDEKIIQHEGLGKAIGNNKYLYLGDIILAFEFIAKNAKSSKKDFEEHLTHLLTHGMLHLIGHDHQTQEMAKIMEDLEIEILHHFNISNPYDN